MHGRLDAIDSFGVTLEQRFDAPVGQIPDPPVYAFRRRACLDEEPESDSLDPAADDETPRYEHEQDIISRSAC